MNNFLFATTSTCPKCRSLVQAKISEKDNRIFMEKSCHQHGNFTALISSNSQYYKKALGFIKPANIPKSFFKKLTEGCPDDCGFCNEHEQHLCMPIIEITNHCNLNCPVCLVDCKKTHHLSLKEFEQIIKNLIKYEGQIDILNLSGGEPLIHPEFKEIIKLCQRPEITRISISTNGLKLLEKPDLAKFLRDKNIVVSLQFDGFNDKVYSALRDRKLKNQKLKIINLLKKLNSPMSLVCTLVKGINELEIKNILDLFLSTDNILSLMIQPMSYAGKGNQFRHDPENRITIPDVIKLIAENSSRRIKEEDFLPLPCSHPVCFSLTFLLKLSGGGFIPINRLVKLEEYLEIIKNKPVFGLEKDDFERIKKLAYELWCGPLACVPEGKKILKTIKALLKEADQNKFATGNLFKIGERNIKSIFIHHFMDAETFDLGRARKCCNAYPQSNGALMPACIFNVLKRK
jgi:uncharacterized radical SAM superfamily Fe-S cluster-containing enzyme